MVEVRHFGEVEYTFHATTEVGRGDDPGIPNLRCVFGLDGDTGEVVQVRKVMTATDSQLRRRDECHESGKVFVLPGRPDSSKAGCVHVYARPGELTARKACIWNADVGQLDRDVDEPTDTVDTDPITICRREKLDDGRNARLIGSVARSRLARDQRGFVFGRCDRVIDPPCQRGGEQTRREDSEMCVTSELGHLLRSV